MTTIWCFNGGSKFPGGLFDDLEKARAWIARNQLTGVLTGYPLNAGVFDWALEQGFVSPALKLKAERNGPNFVGSFTSASQPHFHFETGNQVA
jgi:hypothetical protein